MLTEVWNLLIVNPMMNSLVFIYSIVHNYGIAIIILTILLKLITLPFSIQQQNAMKKQATAQPEVQALQKKYAKDKERLQQEQMKLYKEKGINPLGGCLPMLIPWPLFLAFYQCLQTVVTNQPEQFLELSKHILPALAHNVPVAERFLWLNLSRPDPLYILPALAVITTWLQQKMMAMPNTDPQAQSMNQTMGMIMPFFMGFITLSFASGLAVYWVMFSIVGIVQQFFTTGWGDLAKYVPASIVRRFPGPVPAPVVATAPLAKKANTPRPRRMASSGNVVTRSTRPRRTASSAIGIAPGSAASDDSEVTRTDAGSATVLPARKARHKK